MPTFPDSSELCVCFAHIAYQMEAVYGQRKQAIRHFQTRSLEETAQRLPEAHVLAISGIWQNDLLEQAGKLQYIQSIGAGYDQFPLDELHQRGIRLANARGANRNAVSEHTFGLILGLLRKIHEARDNQRRHQWRGMISNISEREDELAGKTLGIVGMGHIGSRVASIAKAFDMRVIACKRNTASYEGPADEVVGADAVGDLLDRSDVVVLNCPLNDETRSLIDAQALARMKPTAILINVARGACVDTEALLQALEAGEIAGAGLDVFDPEVLAPENGLWDRDDVIITPHTAGETQAYEANVLDILQENIARLQRGETALLNQIV